MKTLVMSSVDCDLVFDIIRRVGNAFNWSTVMSLKLCSAIFWFIVYTFVIIICIYSCYFVQVFCTAIILDSFLYLARQSHILHTLCVWFASSPLHIDEDDYSIRCTCCWGNTRNHLIPSSLNQEYYHQTFWMRSFIFDRRPLLPSCLMCNHVELYIDWEHRKKWSEFIFCNYYPVSIWESWVSTIS